MSDSGANEQIDLTGQVAIVTGGGRGIGRAMALALAKAGAAVAVVARSRDQLAETVGLIEDAGGRAIAVAADVTDRQAVEQMVRELIRDRVVDGQLQGCDLTFRDIAVVEATMARVLAAVVCRTRIE